MAHRKKFNISSLSELFVLLSIVFMVQTIINVSLSEQDIDKMPPPITHITFNQYPTGRNESDHLRYISVGSVVLVFLDTGQCDPDSFRSGQPSSKVSQRNCINLSNGFEHTMVATYAAPADIDYFSREVFRRYGIRVLVTREPDSQAKISMLFDPMKSAENVPIHLGMCICQLHSDHAADEIPLSWNLEQDRFIKPHPMIVQIATFGDVPRRRTALYYSHESDFLSDSGGTKRPISNANSRYAFSRPDCMTGPAVNKLREDFIRDIELSWPALTREPLGDA